MSRRLTQHDLVSDGVVNIRRLPQFNLDLCASPVWIVVKVGEVLVELREADVLGAENPFQL